MARKDNKGRNLKTGEYQRPDGRYEYRYKDEITGKRNSVYAADLVSLREMEKKINKDMDDLLITDASVKKLTVNTLSERYMATKNIKERTKKNYIRMWDYRIRNTLGNIRVVDFKTSHVRTFFSSLSDEEKREPELMPPISSHTLRHTGCTRLGENNVNPKVMQYVMGHSDAQITMNVYNHIAEKSHVENEMSKMNLPETVPAVV